MARQMRRTDAAAIGIEIRDLHADLPRCRALFERRGDKIRVLLNLSEASADRDLLETAVARLPAVLTLVSQTDPAVRWIEADFSDGQESGPGVVAFCSAHPDAILVPDHDFCRSRGYRQFRSAEFDPAATWASRSNTVLWRGTSTGLVGRASSEIMEPDGLLPRVRMCLLLRGVRNVDAKIGGTVGGDRPSTHRQRMAAAGILAERIPPLAWLGCRFAMDIDGNTNAWSNLFTRLLLGNCVIKVASAGGYRQWYYDRLEPGVHFVPVQSDMADLVEKVEWCLGHPAECLLIARAGRELALSVTYERETAAAIERINEYARRRLAPSVQSWSMMDR